MYYVYILKSETENKLYYGYTNDLRRRLNEHNSGKSFSTKNKTPWKLVYYEAYFSEKDARHREFQLKRHAQGLYQLKKRIRNSLQDI